MKFPIAVQKDLGVALFVVQLGGMPDSAKPWKGLSPPGVRAGGGPSRRCLRAVYTVQVGDAVHVLHAFQKKSKSGIAAPQPDVALIEQRLKAVLARHGAGGSTR